MQRDNNCNNVASDLNIDRPPIPKEKWIKMNQETSRKKKCRKSSKSRLVKKKMDKPPMYYNSSLSNNNYLCCSNSDLQCKPNEPNCTNPESCCQPVSNTPVIPSQYEVHLKQEYEEEQLNLIKEREREKQQEREEIQQHHQEELADQQRKQCIQYSQLANRYYQDKRAFQDYAKKSCERELYIRNQLMEKTRQDRNEFESKLRLAYSSRMNRRLREMESRYRKVLIRERSSSRKQMREVCRSFSQAQFTNCPIIPGQCLPRYRNARYYYGAPGCLS